MYSHEDDRESFSAEPLASLFDLHSPHGSQPAMISQYGQGMKLAAIAQTQKPGITMFFICHQGSRTVVALDSHDGGRVMVQHLSLPSDWKADQANPGFSQLDLED